MEADNGYNIGRVLCYKCIKTILKRQYTELEMNGLTAVVSEYIQEHVGIGNEGQEKPFEITTTLNPLIAGFDLSFSVTDKVDPLLST